MSKIDSMSEAEKARLAPEVLKALQDCEARHGSAFLLEAKEASVQVVCRGPQRVEYRRFRKERGDPARRSDAFESIFLACLVYPDPVAFDAVLNKMPALADTFGIALMDDVAGAEDATTKRLG